MRLTVGPLPPAVYWRRRAVVLGAMLLFLIVLLYSCINTGGADDSGRDKTANPGPSPTLTPHVDPSASGPPDSGAPESGAPGGGEPSDVPPGDGEETSVEPAGGGQVPTAPPPVDNECTDQEISVTPVPSQTSAQRGEPIELRLKIKNVSDRTCNRNVGADLQELYIKSGARKVWSSDVCNEVRSNDIRPFPPSHENEYTVSWNGRESSKCANQVAAGPHPVAGTYQLFGRLGNKLSSPVRITITG
ncbi:hypothetical protein R6Y94_16875 [Plantactinospora sp. KLBMP9567]|nr:hypothetical protein [Plantactinospora sp. KLBMP9567]MDW5325508.1 hypothetical protein [Plantactinospora sp. KLBMP9567]